MVVAHLGWVHLDVGQQIAAVTAQQPGELPKSESTQPRCTTTMVTLHIQLDLLNMKEM